MIRASSSASMTPYLDAFGGTLSVEAVAAWSCKWGYTNLITEQLSVRGESEIIAQAEPVVHEVAHAVQFGIPVHQAMTEITGDRFQRYKSMHASDVAECIGLAIERIVFEELGWPITFDHVIDLALEDFRSTMTASQARWFIKRAYLLPVNVRRAGEVVAELWGLTNTGPAEDAPGRANARPLADARPLARNAFLAQRRRGAPSFAGVRPPEL